MIHTKLFSLAICISMLFHVCVISFSNLKKKDKEITVINLSNFQEFVYSEPSTPKKQIKEKKPEIKKKKLEEIIEKKEVKKDILPIKKEKLVPKKEEKLVPIKKEKLIPQKKEQLKTFNENQRPEKSNVYKVKKKTQFTLQNDKSKLINKLLGDYLMFISLEINKMASKSYPVQSIKRREQGTINSVLIINKNGELVDLKLENKSPKRLSKATINLMNSFDFPKPPTEVLDNKGLLKIKIPVRFILK